MEPVVVGFGLGFLVALQVGPMSLFLVRSTLRGGWAVGLAVGAGVALVDALYAACGTAGVAPLLSVDAVRLALGLAVGAGVALVDALYAACGTAGVAPLLSVDAVRLALGLVGAAVLIALGARTVWSALRVRLGAETASEVATPRRAFATAVAGTASNPVTIVSWAAIFAAASASGAANRPGGAILLVAGVGAGSLTWVSLLASATALARRVAGLRAIRLAEALAGVALVAFGGALAWTAARDR